MDAFISLLRLSIFKAFLIGFIFYLVPFADLQASSRGCCSSHGGLAGCNTKTGYLMCKDGTQSPSCKCPSGTTTTKTQATTEATTTTAGATTTSTTESKRGCCKGHGGVAGCDASGYLKCKDGTLSSTCKCTPSKAKTNAEKTTTTTTPVTSSATTEKAAGKRGCCKGHGGVASCDTKSGYQRCKDGTLSATCKCQ